MRYIPGRDPGGEDIAPARAHSIDAAAAAAAYPAAAAAAAAPRARPPRPDGYNSDDECAPRAHGARVYATETDFVNGLRAVHGWEIEHMREDGACLFRAVAFHVFGDQEMHGTVRAHCIDYMDKNRDHFAQFVTEDFDAYLRRKRDAHCHGNHLEIQALSEMYNRKIEVYAYSPEPINTFQAATDNGYPPIRLSYHENVHYNAVVNPREPAFGVGLGLPGLQPGGAAEQKQLEEAMRISEQERIEQLIMEESRREAERAEVEAALEAAILAESRAAYYNYGRPPSH